MTGQELWIRPTNSMSALENGAPIQSGQLICPSWNAKNLAEAPLLKLSWQKKTAPTYLDTALHVPSMNQKT